MINYRASQAFVIGTFYDEEDPNFNAIAENEVISIYQTDTIVLIKGTEVNKSLPDSVFAYLTPIGTAPEPDVVIGGAKNFTELEDVPASYTGNTGKYVRVNGDEDALIFDDISSSVSNFIATPADGDVTVILRASSDCRLSRFTGKLASGTMTVAVKINGVAVTGLTAVAISSVASDVATDSGVGAIEIGDIVSLTISSSSTPINFSFTITLEGGTVGDLSSSGQKDQLNLMVLQPTAQTITVTPAAFFPFSVRQVSVKTSQGTISMAVQINGTSVTGLSAISVTSTVQTVSATGANAVAIDDRVTLVLTSPASVPLNLEIAIGIIRD